MDELEISGKRYISTRRAAREHGYHSDYMGQLIRGKKVVGQKVGRAWYIEEDSLNIYLGKELSPAREQKAAPAAAAEVAPAAAPVERLIIEEPVQQPAVEVVVAAPQPAVAEEVAVVEEIEEEAQPIAVHIEPEQKIAEPVYAQPEVQEIHHAPYIEENERRIPIHTPARAVQETGGLRYTADDTPSIPVVMRMPQTQTQAYAQSAGYAPARQPAGRFPYVSLSIVGILAILATTFASNFITASVVSEEGKAATVQYAIHW